MTGQKDAEVKPDYSEKCDICDQSPVVVIDGDSTGMCGACFFGKAACIDPNNW